MLQGHKLQRQYQGTSPEVFARVLRGLSGAKLTKPGTFTDAEGSGQAVKCSYKVALRMGACVWGVCGGGKGGRGGV